MLKVESLLFVACFTFCSFSSAAFQGNSYSSHRHQFPLAVASTNDADSNRPEHDRRSFLTQSVSVATSPLWLPPSANAAAVAASTATGSPSITNNNLKLPPIGMGCWAWGDSLFWGYNPKNDDDLQQVYDYATSKFGPVLIDTAELYGFGRSEQLLGQYMKNGSGGTDTDQVVLATKFAALPFRTKAENVVKAAEASVRRLGGRPIDLYQIHFPNAFSNEAYWDGMAMAYEKGLIKSIGVSNYGVDAVRACATALGKRGIPLTSNQIQYSLLYRYPEPENNGLLQVCQDLGIQVLAYSPLALGLLTGKYDTLDKVQQIQGPRKQLFAKTVAKPEFQNLLKVMQEVADDHSRTGNNGEQKRVVNLPQVAINFCRSKGTIPIPGARNLRQIESNYASLDWELTSDDIQKLDQASKGLSYIDPSASPFPKKDKDTGLVMFDS